MYLCIKVSKIFGKKAHKSEGHKLETNCNTIYSRNFTKLNSRNFLALRFRAILDKFAQFLRMRAKLFTSFKSNPNFVEFTFRASKYNFLLFLLLLNSFGFFILVLLDTLASVLKTFDEVTEMVLSG